MATDHSLDLARTAFTRHSWREVQSAYSEARYKSDFWLDEQPAKLLLLKVQLLVKKIEVFYLKLIATP